MIKSMTGFGKAFLAMGEGTLTVEVRSLNARFLDIDLRLPRLFTDKEPEIRNLVAKKLQRGKITLVIVYNRKGGDNLMWPYNEDAFVSYYTKLKKLADRVMAPYDTIFQLALQAPQVTLEERESKIDSNMWTQIEKCILEAVDKCDQFRVKEGSALQKMLHIYGKVINDHLIEIKSIEPARAEKMRSRIQEKIATHFNEVNFNENRMEQEILFYVEKMAIDEECVRLQAHLDLFGTVLKHPVSSGKKLTFIAQEMHREINTMGSKANDIEIQKCVITLKEELEKIREQLSNIL